MKFSRDKIISRVHKIPELKFEDQRLTSFSGLVIFQQLFSSLELKQKLRKCFKTLEVHETYKHYMVMMLLIVHLLIGYRKLRDIEYYKDDPMVKRILGLEKLPDVSTISRRLRTVDAASIENLRELCIVIVIERLKKEGLRRITMDFDGSVISTAGRTIEGTAVGFNKKKKGQRSYYPLFCTIAQLGQIFNFLHRPGNVHDSNGAKAFILACIARIREEIPGIKIEARMDSAFFCDEIVKELDRMEVEYTISVPFERFAILKQEIESRKWWRRLDDRWSFFQKNWKPKSWKKKYRFVFIRQKSKQMRKGPIQLDLFIPYEYGYDFKVIVTNKRMGARKVLVYHNGRGSQENIFGEAKSQSQLDYIAVRRLYGNQFYMVSAILAYNLSRELQMAAKPKDRGTTEKRSPLWKFEGLQKIRQNLIQRAGRLTTPQGTLTLTMSANKKVQEEILHYINTVGDNVCFS